LVAAPPAADQAREAQLPARKLTTEEKAAQKASEAREAMAVAAEAERAKAEAKKLGDQEKRIADDEQRVADSEAERKHVEKMQRAAEQHGRGEDAASSTAKSTADAKQRKEVHKQTVSSRRKTGRIPTCLRTIRRITMRRLRRPTTA